MPAAAATAAPSLPPLTPAWQAERSLWKTYEAELTVIALKAQEMGLEPRDTSCILAKRRKSNPDRRALSFVFQIPGTMLFVSIGDDGVVI
jgi:hypothetical protein